MNRRRFNISPLMIVLIILVVSRILNGSMGNPKDWIVTHLLMLPGILMGLSLHEFGHAWVSDKLGDPTPRSQGRVTINPMAHVDPMGLICLIIAGFGWGIPVQINPQYYKNRRRDEALTAVAGVTMNLIIAIVSTIILKVLVQYLPNSFIYSTTGTVIVELFNYMILINIILMIFNLLPIPPLDGFSILTQIFNLQKYSWYYPLYNNGSIILLLIILFGGTSYILSPLVNLVYGSLISLVM